MLTAIFIVALLILVALVALAYLFYTFSNNFTIFARIFASNYESAELTKIKLMKSIKKELSKTDNTEKE